MDSIKCKCKNWIVYFKKLDNFHLFHLIVEKLDVFNIKCGNITEKKNKTFERYLAFLIFLNIDIWAKSKQIELDEEFIAMWRDSHTGVFL